MEMTRNMPDDQQSLPPYTYVPGLTPHPISDPAGHSSTARIDVEGHTSAVGQGQTLFDAGYYWEAHEAWEHAWKGLGGRGPAADLLKALIKLAAAGVKCLEANPAGVVRHARRVVELIEATALPEDGAVSELQSLDWPALKRLAGRLCVNPPLADETQRLRACVGGVPILGQIPSIPRDHSR